MYNCRIITVKPKYNRVVNIHLYHVKMYLQFIILHYVPLGRTEISFFFFFFFDRDLMPLLDTMSQSNMTNLEVKIFLLLKIYSLMVPMNKFLCFD